MKYHNELTDAELEKVVGGRLISPVVGEPSNAGDFAVPSVDEPMQPPFDVQPLPDPPFHARKPGPGRRKLAQGRFN